MNPFLDTIFLAIVIAILVWNTILIFKEQDKRLKFIKLSILVLSILLGFCKARTELDSLAEETPRIYYNTHAEVENYKIVDKKRK